jgi:hypothetical protein
MSIYGFEPPSDLRQLSSAEEAGVAACRAGQPEDATPFLRNLVSTVSERNRAELAHSWLRGWNHAQILQEVSERMFPASFAPSAMS